MSPDVAGFGFTFQNDANFFIVTLYMRIDWNGENPPGQGTGPTEIRCLSVIGV